MRDLRRWVPGVVLAGVAAASYARLYFGVDFTDEAFYAEVPYHFVLGGSPIADELNVVQLTSGALLYPPVWAYHALFGVDGLILYLRHVYFLFTLAMTFALYRALARVSADRALAALAAAVLVVFVPFEIHALGYNTFATQLFTVGCAAGMAWDRSRDRRWLALAGVAQGLAVFAYPPLAIGAAVFFAVLYVRVRPVPIRALAVGVLPALAGAALAAAFLLQDGLTAARNAFHDASRYGGQGGNAGKALTVVEDVFRQWPHPYVCLALIALAAILARLRPRAAAVPLLALPFVSAWAPLSTSTASNRFVTDLAFVAPLAFLGTRHDRTSRGLMAIVWVPSIVAGEVTALSSGNGAINFCIGALPAAVVGLVLLASLARRWTSADLVLCVAVLAVGMVFQYGYVYRDRGISSLTSRVHDGAYAGIYTTPATSAFVGRLSGDLASIAGSHCGVLFYDKFPGGYLLSGGKPDAWTSWVLDVKDDREAEYERLLLSYYRGKPFPPVVVRVLAFPVGDEDYTPAYSPGSPFARAFGSPRYSIQLRRPGYVISRRAGAQCS